MFPSIRAIFSNVQMQFGPSIHKWINFITPSDVLIRVRAYIREEGFLNFDVRDDGSLCYTHRENVSFSCSLQKEVRVVGNDGSN